MTDLRVEFARGPRGNSQRVTAGLFEIGFETLHHFGKIRGNSNKGVFRTSARRQEADEESEAQKTADLYTGALTEGFLRRCRHEGIRG